MTKHTKANKAVASLLCDVSDNYIAYNVVADWHRSQTATAIVTGHPDVQSIGVDRLGL